MNVTRVTTNGVVPLADPMPDHGYLGLALRGTSFGAGAVVTVEYSPDAGQTWSPVEGLSSADATSPLKLGSFRTIRVPDAALRLVVAGSTGSTDFFADHAVSLW